jgi:hypothetical protein
LHWGQSQARSLGCANPSVPARVETKAWYASFIVAHIVSLVWNYLGLIPIVGTLGTCNESAGTRFRLLTRCSALRVSRGDSGDSFWVSGDSWDSLCVGWDSLWVSGDSWDSLCVGWDSLWVSGDSFQVCRDLLWVSRDRYWV